MRQSEIKELSTAELQEKLGELKKSYADLKMAHSRDFGHSIWYTKYCTLSTHYVMCAPTICKAASKYVSKTRRD